MKPTLQERIKEQVKLITKTHHNGHTSSSEIERQVWNLVKDSYRAGVIDAINDQNTLPPNAVNS